MIQFKDGLLKKVEISGTASATMPNKLNSSQQSRVWCACLCTDYFITFYCTLAGACSLHVTNVDKRQRVSWASQNNRHEARTTAHVSHSADDRCSGHQRPHPDLSSLLPKQSWMFRIGGWRRRTGDCKRLAGYMSCTRQLQFSYDSAGHWQAANGCNVTCIVSGQTRILFTRCTQL